MGKVSGGMEMGATYEQESLNSLLEDIRDLQTGKKHTNNALLVNVALVLKEAMQSNNTASLNVLLTVIKDDHINVRDLILAVIERQEKNLER